MKPRVHVAGRPFAPWFDPVGLPPELRKVFDPHPGGLVASYPGILAGPEGIGVILPRCYPETLGDKERLVAAGHLLRVLIRYLREDGARRSVAQHSMDQALSTSGPVESSLARLEAALLLWDDWLRQGPLPVAERDTGPDVPGRVHWPQTLTRAQVLVSGESVVYARPIRTRFALAPQHPLTLLHARTSREAGAWLGWLPTPSRSPLDSDEALETIERHARRLYQDRQKRICGWLRQYHSLQRADQRGRQRGIAGVFAVDFPRVWEQMLFVGLGSSPRPKLPDGRYHFLDGRPPASATGFHVDLFFEVRWRGEPATLVLDAKDYKPGSVPGSESVNKQLLYRLLLSDRFLPGLPPLDRVGNGFLSPAVVPDGARLTAVHQLDGEQGQPVPLGRIACIEVDFARVAAAYTRGRFDGVLREQIVDMTMSSLS